MPRWNVTNVPDDRRDTDANCPECGPWIEHWKVMLDNLFDEPLLCANTECENEAEHGGHVFIPRGEGRMWIIPICAACNRLSDSYVSRHRPVLDVHPEN